MGVIPPAAPSLDARAANELAIIAAATAYRDADSALADHLATRPAGWNRPREDVSRDVNTEWRRRRLELTEAVSRARVALLEAALK